MPNFCKVILVGHLTRDPEVKYTPGGLAIAEIGIAYNEKRKDAEEVSFFDVTCFGKTAELVGEHLDKGRAVLIEGRLKQERWQDKASGKGRSAVKIVADRVQFLGSAVPVARTAGDEEGEDNVPF